MDSINFLLIFDMIILVYGMWIAVSAVRMRKTKVPAKMLISEEELKGSKDPEGFCDAIFGKTLFMGIFCMIYGGVTGINEWTASIKPLSMGALAILLIVILWYGKEMRSAKSQYIG